MVRKRQKSAAQPLPWPVYYTAGRNSYMFKSFEKKGQSIYTFRHGDVIFRVKPVFRTVPAEALFLSATKTLTDNSFRTPIEFLDIKNNLIYLKECNYFKEYYPLFLNEKPTVFRAALELYWDNWELFESGKNSLIALSNGIASNNRAESVNDHEVDISGLFATEGQSIHAFKPGDVIIRVKPVIRTVHRGSLFSFPETWNDNSLREPMEFLGIKNNKIILQWVSTRLFQDRKISKVELKSYENNWALFEMPEGVEHVNDILF